MADPTSTPVPAYITPLGETQEPRVYLVERLSEEAMLRLEDSPETPRSEDRSAFDFSPLDEQALTLRAAANDSAPLSLQVLLFVGSSYVSRRMLRTARDLVARVGATRASLRIVDVADEAGAAEVRQHRVTFTPTMVLDAGEVRTRVVGAASLDALFDLLPDFRED